MVPLLKRIFTNRIGWLLAVVHFCLIVYDFAQKKPLSYDANVCEPPPAFAGQYILAGRSFHLYYESLIHQVIFYLDIPASIVGGLVMIPVAYLLPANFCVYTASWVIAFVLLATTSLQWMIVGLVIQRTFAKPK
ncbi:MAG: hypothetical protein KIS76_12020 [Pyrinomonadaceae bacterium]|nr:hypothetical protein [Pyrinomonadaceae bacterium]